MSSNDPIEQLKTFVEKMGGSIATSGQIKQTVQEVLRVLESHGKRIKTLEAHCQSK